MQYRHKPEDEARFTCRGSNIHLENPGEVTTEMAGTKSNRGKQSLSLMYIREKMKVGLQIKQENNSKVAFPRHK